MGKEFNLFILIFLFFLSTQLIITTFLVELQQNPRKFLFCKFLRQGFLAQIVDGPVVGDFLAVGNKLRLIFSKICEHFIERIDEKELGHACFVFFPSQFRLCVIDEFTVSVNLIGIVFRQKVHQFQYTQETFAAQQIAF